MTVPCPICGSTTERRGFCCDSCHAAYMRMHRPRWHEPGTARSEPDWPRASDRASACADDVGSPIRSRPGRPDRCYSTDEQADGAWANVVRAYEEAGCN